VYLRVCRFNFGIGEDWTQGLAHARQTSSHQQFTDFLRQFTQYFIQDFFFFFFGNTGLHTCEAGTLLLEPCLQPFCSGYLEIGSRFLRRLAWTMILYFELPAIAGMAEVTTMSSFFLLKCGLTNIFAWAVLELQSCRSAFNVPGMTVACHQAQFFFFPLRWGLVDCLPEIGLELQSSLFQPPK
jgi:hypothetical protein